VLSSAAAQQREELVQTAEGKLFPARCVPEPEPDEDELQD
jgi:hypothetical protein